MYEIFPVSFNSCTSFAVSLVVQILLMGVCYVSTLILDLE